VVLIDCEIPLSIIPSIQDPHLFSQSLEQACILCTLPRFPHCTLSTFFTGMTGSLHHFYLLSKWLWHLALHFPSLILCPYGKVECTAGSCWLVDPARLELQLLKSRLNQTKHHGRRGTRMAAAFSWEKPWIGPWKSGIRDPGPFQNPGDATDHIVIF
jgi:hypothetical protein